MTYPSRRFHEIFEDFARAMNAPLQPGGQMRTEQFYRDQADEMLARAALAAKIAVTPDVWVEGTVVSFTRKAPDGDGVSRQLAYAARKVTTTLVRLGTTEARWYITGTTSRPAYTWEKLLDFIGADGLATLEVMQPGFFPFAPDVTAPVQA